MIIAKLENKDVEELTLNFKNALGEVIQYNTTYFEDLERLETITLNGFDVNNDLIEKLNCLEKLKIIIFNHCKFICDDKLKNDIENIIITYSNIANSNIFEEHIEKPFPNGESLKDVERRIDDFIKFLKDNYHGKKVGIVAHRAPQLAFEVLTKNISWEEANRNDWRKAKAWQPGWEYIIK